MTEKTCTRCYVSKPLDQFTDGQARCRPCRSEQWTLHRQEKRDQERRELDSMLSGLINWPPPGRVLR